MKREIEERKRDQLSYCSNFNEAKKNVSISEIESLTIVNSFFMSLIVSIFDGSKLEVE